MSVIGINSIDQVLTNSSDRFTQYQLIFHVTTALR